MKKLKSTRFPQCTPKRFRPANDDLLTDSASNTNESPDGRLSAQSGSTLDVSIHEGTPMEINTQNTQNDPSEGTPMESNTQSDPYDFEEATADQIIPKEYSNGFGVKFQVGDVMALGLTKKTHDLVQIREILETEGKVMAMYIEKKRDRTLAPFTNKYTEPIPLMFNHLIFRCTRKDYLSIDEENEIKDKLSNIFN